MPLSPGLAKLPAKLGFSPASAASEFDRRQGGAGGIGISWWPQAGHSMHVDNPAFFNQKVIDFVQTH